MSDQSAVATAPPPGVPREHEPAAPARRRLWGRLKDRWFVPAVLLVSLVLHYPALLVPLTSDEAGFLLVSRTLSPTAESPFGPYWVDRPVLLMWAYQLGDLLGGAYGVRILSAAGSLLMLVALYSVARLQLSRSAARVTLVAAAALVANPEMDAWTGKGEILGTALVGLSACLTCAALHRRRRAALWMLASGAAAGLAVGMKQNLLSGVVFAAVMLAAAAATGVASRRDVVRLAGAGLAGVAVPWLAVGLWVAATPATLSATAYQLVGFRADASAVIANSDSSAPLERAHQLWDLVWASGMGFLLVSAVLLLVPALRRRSGLAMAVLAGLVVDVIGVAGGGSYWHAYLIPLIPWSALLVGMLADSHRRIRWLATPLVLVTCISSVSFLADFTVQNRTGESSPTAYNLGRAIGASAEPGDTIVSLYGHPDVVFASGLPSPYPELWSLPMRTLDPHLSRLRGLLRGDSPPTWVDVTLPLNSWGLDPDGRLQSIMDRRYVRVYDGCGGAVWRLRSADRPALPKLSCTATWSLL